jgi:hypothetical protein
MFVIIYAGVSDAVISDCIMTILVSHPSPTINEERINFHLEFFSRFSFLFFSHSLCLLTLSDNISAQLRLRRALYHAFMCYSQYSEFYLEHNRHKIFSTLRATLLAFFCKLQKRIFMILNTQFKKLYSERNFCLSKLLSKNK